MQHIDTTEYYWALKKKEILTHATIWMNKHYEYYAKWNKLVTHTNALGYLKYSVL